VEAAGRCLRWPVCGHQVGEYEMLVIFLLN
jgi:hypothetical protein